MFPERSIADLAGKSFDEEALSEHSIYDRGKLNQAVACAPGVGGIAELVSPPTVKHEIMNTHAPTMRRFLSACLPSIVSTILLVGCGTTRIARRIESGGFLQPQDYAQLQRVAAAEPIDWPKSWAEKADRMPSPKWIYYTLQGEDLRRFDTVAIPDLAVSVPEARGLAKEIPDLIAKELVARRIFREAARQDLKSGLVLVGGMTSAAWGSALLGSVQTAAGAGFGSEQHFLQVEFKIVADNKPVGAIQVYAQRFAGLGSITLGLAQGSLTGQMASGVIDSMKGLKAGIPEQASEINCLPGNYK